MTSACARLFALGASTIAWHPSLAADRAYGEYLAAECSPCHRLDAADTAMPPLQFLSYEYLVTALEEYRSGARADPAMQSVARSLGDAEIKALAAYFSSLRGDP